MAGDWIKMRANLQTHPKVVRISSALKADRLRTVGGLHAVWCLFDEHSEDGRLCGYTPDAVDGLIGWPGFTEQLIAVGWVEWDGQDGMQLPEFDTHNGASAKRRAMEAERKRAERAAAKDGCDASASDADKKRTREEKRRGDKKPPKAPQGALQVPDWIPAKPWEDFVAMRRAKGTRNPFTVGAAKGIVSQLERFREAGHDLAEVLNQSTRNGWSDVYEPKGKPASQPAQEAFV